MRVCVYIDWLEYPCKPHVNRICAMSLRSLLVWNCLKFASDHSWKVPSHYKPRLRCTKSSHHLIVWIRHLVHAHERNCVCAWLHWPPSPYRTRPHMRRGGGWKSPSDTCVYVSHWGRLNDGTRRWVCVWVGGLLQSVYCAVQFIRFYVYACDSVPGTMCDMITVTPAVETVSMAKWGRWRRGVGEGKWLESAHETLTNWTLCMCQLTRWHLFGVVGAHEYTNQKTRDRKRSEKKEKNECDPTQTNARGMHSYVCNMHKLRRSVWNVVSQRIMQSALQIFWWDYCEISNRWII